MTKHLRVDIYYLEKHAQEVMKDLGITYQHATPQSMGDQWWFWNCENIPEVLPDYITELTADPFECIGYGLSLVNAQKIANYGLQPSDYVQPPQSAVEAWKRITDKQH